ncbi:hypothetical protein F4677DRAFT_160415 [Hypoxylon crocopeplum]|nr:hypothetical protein F4677DRAFT_160415 [Hypoxylon crocopeplum]
MAGSRGGINQKMADMTISGNLNPASGGYQGMSQSSSTGSAQVPVGRQPRPLDLNMGDKKSLIFCPWKLIKAYPYMYINGRDQGEVGSCFKETLLGERAWDFFFLLDPGTNGRDPLLLVPTTQFEGYLSDVNFQIKKRLGIPSGKASIPFSLVFGENDTPVPRFLGRASSEEAVEALKLQICRLPIDDLGSLGPATLQLYMKKMDTIYNSLKSGKNKKDPEVTRKKRAERQKGYGRMIKRAQRYLGLRERASYRSKSGTSAAGWNVKMPVPFKAKDSLRFVCVDVEAWETSSRVVTEVGLAVLDTEDTIDVPPGKDGHNWFPLINSYHFRIREHMNKVNHMYVQGCPDKFGFGDTEFVRLGDIGRTIGGIIGDYQSSDKRPVVMVGHDIGQDLKYLQKVGYNIWRVPYFSDEMDTKSMFQRVEKSSDGRALATICEDLGIPGRYFHNAGNDATYTLRAMVVMTVKQMKGTAESQKENDADDPEHGEWSDGEMDDGGLPQKSPELIQQSANSSASTAGRSQW